MARELGHGLDAEPVQSLINAAHQLAQLPASGSSHGTEADRLRRLIGRVIVRKGRVAISIDRNALSDELAEIDERVIFTPAHEGPIELVAAASALRCGKQVRLVLGKIESATCAADPDLLTLIATGHRWFDDLRTGKVASIAAIAERDRQQVSHVSRNLSLAFLAPDIVEAILAGRQPITLTPERLKAARPLPLDWSEQRALLLG